jgi:hypothetical protein
VRQAGNIVLLGMIDPARHLRLAQEASKRQHVHKGDKVRRKPLHITTTRIFDIDATVLLNDQNEPTGKVSLIYSMLVS